MAYVEVRRDGEVIVRRWVEDKRAREGCAIRLGPKLRIRVALGESTEAGGYQVAVIEGDPPGATPSPRPGGPADGGEAQSAEAAIAKMDRSQLPDIEGYEIERPLGEGAFGTVWKAVQLATGREVALKFLTTASVRTPHSRRQRFEREVKLCARLNHPAVARIYDSGLHRNVYFYAMELIDGVDLDVYIAREKLSQRRIVELMRDVCRAIGHAHERDVIHRDLKPSNILVTADGQPHVVDFGLAKTIAEDESVVTVSIEGQVAGTPAFMSPEQAAGRIDQLDARTDVYTLGVLLYQLLTGQMPHDLSGTHYQLIRRIVEEPVRRPRDLAKNIDRELEAILLKTLGKEPGERYANASELADDLDNYLEGRPIAARPPTFLYSFRKRIARHRLPVAVFAVSSLLTTVVIFAALYLVLGGRTPTPQTQPAGPGDQPVKAPDSPGTEAELAAAFAKVHPRLFASPERIEEIRLAIEVPGSHHAEAFGAMKARVDSLNLFTYGATADLRDAARSFLAREAAMLYVLTRDKKLASLAYKALEDTYEVPDTAVAPTEAGRAARAFVDVASAMAYDWCGAAWPAEHRKRVETFLRHRLAEAPASQPAGGAASAALVDTARRLIVLLALAEESSRTEEVRSLKAALLEHLRTDYGELGLPSSGLAGAVLEGAFLLPAIQALRRLGDTTLDQELSRHAWWKWALFAGTFPSADRPRPGFLRTCGGEPTPSAGWASLLLDTVPKPDLGHYLYWYDRSMGKLAPVPASEKYDGNWAGTVWALLDYPQGLRAANPTGQVDSAADDGMHGLYYFRNRWKDHTDVQFAVSAGVAPKSGGAVEGLAALQIQLLAYGTRFFGGLPNSNAHASYSAILVDGKAHAGDPAAPGQVGSFRSDRRGGYVVVGGGKRYADLGLSQAKRHVLARMNGGSAVIATLDRLRADQAHEYTWNLNLGDAEGDDGVEVSQMVEGGRAAFVLRGRNSGFVKAWVLHPPDARIKTGDPTQVTVSGTNVDIWVAMHVGQGAPPVGKIGGAGLATTLTLGQTTVWFDEAMNRISLQRRVSESLPVASRPAPSPHPRLLVTPQRVAEARKAVAQPGSYTAEVFAAVKARVDKGDLGAYKRQGVGDNVARGLLVQEAALAYLLTGDKTYAALAHKTLADVHLRAGGDGALPEKGEPLDRAALGLAFACAYDWCYDAWRPPDRRSIHARLLVGLDAWQKTTDRALRDPFRASPVVGACRGAELAMLLAVAGEGEDDRAEQYKLASRDLLTHLRNGYGDLGGSPEGIGQAALAGVFFLPAVLSARDAGDASFDEELASHAWWRLALFAGPFAADAAGAGRFLRVGGTGPWPQSYGWTSLLLRTVPRAQLPHYLWWYDRFTGRRAPAPPEVKYAPHYGAAVWAILAYPEGVAAADPGRGVGPAAADGKLGACFFRNRWVDAEDVQFSVLADAGREALASSSGEAFQLDLRAYGTRFFGGPGGGDPAQTDFSTILVDGKNHTGRGGPGKLAMFEPSADGGYVLIDGARKYTSLGLTEANRHVLVRMSETETVIATFDRLRAPGQHTYTWNVNVGDHLGDDGVTGFRSMWAGRPMFVLRGRDKAYVKGWVLHPAGRAIIKVGDPTQISVTGEDEDIWVVMLVGKGTPPVGEINGKDLASEITVGDTTIRFDSRKNRMVVGGGGRAAGPSVPTVQLEPDPVDPLMGEYVGTYVPADGKPSAAQAKVLPRGDDLHEVILTAALPPQRDGRLRVLRLAGEAKGGRVRLSGKPRGEWTGTLGDGKLVIQAKADASKAALRFHARRPPSVGMAPPPGAVVLLAYRSDVPPPLTEWDNPTWRPQPDGSMEVGKGDIRTNRTFGDVCLHVEFLCPYLPDKTGKASGDSGVALQDRYEVQVLDSFGEDTRPDDCGAILGKAGPAANACLPPRRWQTYDIVFHAAAAGRMPTITVVHNGVPIHRNVELTAPTDKRSPGQTVPKDVLRLQDGGAKVRYRNIWAVELGKGSQVPRIAGLK